MKMRQLSYYIIFLFVFISLPFNTDGKNREEDKITIVLDPGHGGKDFGACENGAKEKDINLAVAKRLKELVEKNLEDVKIVMTRNTDKYLTLQQRADIANEAGGDLFMSIHVNSVDRKNPRRKQISGSSVYVLGLHKDQDNMKVAMRENSVIELESDYKEKYSGFDPSKDESYIIFEMAQKRNLGESIRVASDAQNFLIAKAGRANRGVRQAGFWVLWATSMPAVLVELDFICNSSSVDFMTSQKGEEKLAEALYESIKKFIERRN